VFEKIDKKKGGEKMKKYLLLMVAMVLVLSMTNAAQAISIPAGPLSFHWTDWETRVTGNGQSLNGIFRLDQILQGTTVVWNAGAGEELTGSFQNLTVASFGGETPGSQILFTGGDLQVYLDNTPDFDPTQPGVGVTDGTLWIDADFTTGVDFFNPGATLVSTVTSSGSDQGPDGIINPTIRGTGTALLDVVGGSAASTFDSNLFPRLDGSGLFADLSLSANFFITNTGSAPFTATTNGWDVWSSDPIKANAIPEPTSMLLFGMGLAGLVSKKLRKTKVA